MSDVIYSGTAESDAFSSVRGGGITAPSAGMVVGGPGRVRPPAPLARQGAALNGAQGVATVSLVSMAECLECLKVLAKEMGSQASAAATLADHITGATAVEQPIVQPTLAAGGVLADLGYLVVELVNTRNTMLIHHTRISQALDGNGKLVSPNKN